MIGQAAQSHQTPPTAAIAADCRHYKGDKPCFQNRLCTGCNHYAPFTSRICIVKLGALGDVIRTLSILPALAKQHPNAQITWVSKTAGCRMIKNHPLIQRTLEFNPINAMVLLHESFDLVISLDKEPEPCSLVMGMKAGRKIGVGMNACGKPYPLNDEALDYFHLGLSDQLKFHTNTKGYPQLVHEALGLPYDWTPYELPVDSAAAKTVHALLASKGWNPSLPTLGVNVGAGKVFANKMWPADQTAQVIRLFKEAQGDFNVLLLGGPEERPIVDAILADLSATNQSADVIDAGTDHEEASFVALVDACDLLFTGDTMAMHVGVARKKAIVAFLGPTCEQEIELFGRGIKLVAKTACSPCYKRACDHDDACLKQITPGMAADALAAMLQRVRETQTQTDNQPSQPHRLPLALPQIPTRKAG